MKTVDLLDIAMKLNGSIQPAGDSGIDAWRYQNLDSLIELVDGLIQEILDASYSADRQEASMMQIGRKAKKYLGEMVTRVDAEINQ